VKTNASGRLLILNSGSYWGTRGQFFNLGINKGNLELALQPNIFTTTKNLVINDGEWHHLAVVLPHFDAKIDELRLFVDGKLIEEKHTTNPQTRINTQQANWMAIATQKGNYNTDLSAMGIHDFTGLLDDFSIWTRALSDSDINLLYTEGLKGMNALSVEEVIRDF
jgi:hypothetical protein